jgi:branched-chain amino acid transport system substrate-binding protein
MSDTAKKTWIGVIILIVIIILGYLMFLGGNGSESDKEGGVITIGFIGPLTGDYAAIGTGIKGAMQYAIDEVNKDGGIDGKTLQAIYEDDACDPTMAANAVNKLVNVDKVTAIIGGTCSSATLAGAPIAEAAGVPMISYASTSPLVTTAGDYIFRDVPSDMLQATYIANYIYDNLNSPSVAVMYVNNDWGKGIATQFVESYKGTIVAEESHVEGATDLRTQIAKVLDANPEVIYFPSYATDAISGIKQLDEAGVLDDITVIGGDSWDQASIWTDLGSIGEGMIYSRPANIEPTSEYTTGVAQYITPDQDSVYAARGYDAIMILAQAMKTAKDLTGESIKDSLYNIQNLQGVADNYSFDENGDLKSANYEIVQIKSSERVPLE